MNDKQCSGCGTDLTEQDTLDGTVSPFEFGSLRADVFVQCDECGDVTEWEVQVITSYR